MTTTPSSPDDQRADVKVLHIHPGEPDEKLVQNLEYMLEAAKEGSLTGLYSIVQHKGGEFEPVLCGNCDDVPKVVGMLHFLIADMVERTRQGDDDE